MRALILLFIIVSSALTSSAQTIEGIYSNKWESPSGEAIAYNLTLKEDGTFTFQLTRTYLDSVSHYTTKTKGNWVLANHLLTLKTNERANELSSELNMNKARFVSLSPRNPNFNIVYPYLKFYESDVFYAKDMELIKTESSVTSSE
jgi:hypothetical protein